MPDRRWTDVGALAVILALCALVIVLARQKSGLGEELRRARWEAEYPHEGMVVPPFEAAALDGERHVIAGGPERQLLALLDTVCPHSKVTVPSWNELAGMLGERPELGIRLIGIVVGNGAAAREIAGHPVRFPIVHFPDERTGRLYHDAGVPATLLVDGGGRVLRVHMGRLPEPGLRWIRCSGTGLHGRTHPIPGGSHEEAAAHHRPDRRGRRRGGDIGVRDGPRDGTQPQGAGL
jgi:hypothetical protein